MTDALKNELRRAGWKPGTYKGFWRASRAGIEFQVGSSPALGSDRLALRYQYRTERTDTGGEVALPGDATLAQVEDALADVYWRIHEKPDVTRVFGQRRRARARQTANKPVPNGPHAAQTALDL
jgi:hypothetical protein